MSSCRSPWRTLEQAKDVVRQWNRLPLGYVAAYDGETDEFVFAAPGWSEPRRFKPLVLRVDGVDVKKWAVGTIAAGQATVTV